MRIIEDEIPKAHLSLIQAGRWPEGLPRTYNELFNAHARTIAVTLQRCNRIKDDQLDLMQHIWGKLKEGQVLLRYATSLSEISRPEYVTGSQACQILGLSDQDFTQLVRSVRRRGEWFPDPCKYSSTTNSDEDLWSVRDITRIANNTCTALTFPPPEDTCFQASVQGPVECVSQAVASKMLGLNTGVEFESILNEVRCQEISGWNPRPHHAKREPILTGEDVTWRFADILRLSQLGDEWVIGEVYWGDHSFSLLPGVGAMPRHFEGYLKRAVKNHFLNWCRTKRRRHQERLGTDILHMGEDQNWEDILRDPHVDSEMQTDIRTGIERILPTLQSITPESIGQRFREIVLDLTHRREVLSKGPVEPVSIVEAAGHCVLSVLEEDDGTLTDAIDRLDISRQEKQRIYCQALIPTPPQVEQIRSVLSQDILGEGELLSKSYVVDAIFTCDHKVIKDDGTVQLVPGYKALAREFGLQLL